MATGMTNTETSTTDTAVITADEFAEMTLEGPHDLVRGKLVSISRPGEIHCAVCLTIGAFLKMWARKSGFQAFSNDVGVVTATGPDTVRGPDLAVIKKRSLTVRAMRTAPLLVVEVLSPSNTRTEILSKLVEFFRVGTSEAWVFDPSTREAEVFRPDAPVRRVLADGLFETAELPGFSATLADCFEDLDD